jgi:PKD repeat protein
VEVEHGYPSAGTYVVEVRVRDDDGEEALAQVPVKVVNRPPIAEGTQSATSVMEGENVTFDATGSRDTAGDMEDLTIEWTRGPDVRTGKRVTFLFEEEGSFSIILTVTDDDGALSQLFFTVKVSNQVPNAVPSVDRTEAGVGRIFNFAALDLTDTPNDLPGLTVSWSFDDGELGTGLSVAHRYDEAGDYTVTMTVRDDDGATYEGYLYITVTEEEGIMSGTTMTLAIVAAVAAIVVSVITLLVLRRAKVDEDDDPGPEEGPTTPSREGETSDEAQEGSPAEEEGDVE